MTRGTEEELDVDDLGKDSSSLYETSAIRPEDQGRGDADILDIEEDSEEEDSDDFTSGDDDDDPEVSLFDIVRPFVGPCLARWVDRIEVVTTEAGAVGMWLMGPILIVVYLALMLACAFVFLNDVVFIICGESFGFVKLFLQVGTLWMVFNCTFNFVQCCRTDPGEPMKIMEYSEKHPHEEPDAPKKGKGWSKFCRFCNFPKPLRAHHCHVCNRCCLKNDHHCPWVGNCVGFYNQRYFVTFLAYTMAGCMFIVFFNGIALLARWRTVFVDGTLIFLVWVLCLTMGVTMIGFTGWHFYLVLTGQSTIEFHFNRWRKKMANKRRERWVPPFNYGWKSNWDRVFGPDFKLWKLITPSFRVPPGDGINWPIITASPQSSVARKRGRGPAGAPALPGRREAVMKKGSDVEGTGGTDANSSMKAVSKRKVPGLKKGEFDAV